jgi:peptide/nickel transport system substrate-binding protein
MKRRTGLIVAVFLAVSLVLSGCAKPAEPPAPAPAPAPQPPPAPPAPVKELKGEIVYGMTGDPIIFNPILATDTPSGFVNVRVYEGLVRYNEKLEFVPLLAKEWSFSEDGLEWTFKLRDDVYWHDGVKFTAKDVKFTYDAIKHPDYTGIRRTDFKPVEKVEIVNDYEVKLLLNQPFAPLLSKLGIGIIPEHIFSQNEIGKMREHPANQAPIGTGPYVWGEWQKGQHLVLKANPNYWGDGPWIERIRIRFLQDEQVMLAALENGEIDYMGSVPVDDYPRIKESHKDKLNFWEFPSNGYTYIGLKQNHSILQDKRVRQALAYGLNRKEIVDEIFKGYGTVMNANLPPISWAYREQGLNPYSYDKAKAIALLEEAGWKTVGADGIRRNDKGEKLSFQLVTSTGNTRYEAALMITQQQWKEIGVECRVEFFEWSVLLNQYLDVAKFEAYMLGWGLGLDPDCYLFFHSTAGVDADGNLVGFNDVEYSNPRVDELLELGRTTMDPKERKAIYDELQLIFNEELPYIFMYTQNVITAMNKKFQGVTISPLGPIFPEQWYIVDPK